MDTRLLADDAAIHAAIESVGPRRYRVTGLPTDQPIRIFLLGCHGEQGENQLAVAKLMNEKAALHRPHLISFGGDNIYNGAVTTLNDPRFVVRYSDVYNLEYLKSVARVMILGNHDANREHFARFLNQTSEIATNLVSLFSYSYAPYNVGKEAEKFEVARTYVEKDISIFREEILATSDMTGWNMPYYFCSYILNETTEFFCLNSNTLVASAINKWTNASSEQYDQQMSWFLNAYNDAKSKNRTVIISLHNPTVTSSKRYDPRKYDATLYLKPEEIQQMNHLLSKVADGNVNALTEEYIAKVFMRTDSAINSIVSLANTNGSYADMIALCLKVENVAPKLIITAHDHALVFNQKPGSCQVISGAGGSKNLMEKVTNANDNTLGCFISEPGFVSVTLDRVGVPNPEMTFDYYTTLGTHLTFKNTQREPIYDNRAELAAAALATETSTPALR